jgi:SpoVK/Ycf46/Vps4 family AAA+-type ATPase
MCRSGNQDSADALVGELEARLCDLVQPSSLKGIIVERPRLPLSRVIASPYVTHSLQRLLLLGQSFALLEAEGRIGAKALFAGPSGTGKTLAARALAHSLGRPLYRVDLAAVVSKWVGETEKNLRDAMTAAELSGAVLLFDEGDALFGKRGEVTKGTDRYANVEVSFLLQAIEAFEGIALVTTNMRNNIDEAFERRFDMTIEFTRPDKHQRELIWRQELASAGADLPAAFLPELARRAELHGGQIAAAARIARVLAFERGDLSVTAADLRAAVQGEFLKMGSSVQAARWVRE